MKNHPALTSALTATLLAIGWLLTIVHLHAGEIHDAAVAGDLAKVKALLDANPSLLESKDKDGETPLLKACIGVPDDNTQPTMVRFLIDQGANVNASGPSGRTPLMCVNARQEECIDLMQRLIAKGADVNACMSYTTRKWTVFIGAAKSGNTEAARLLIQHGADINVRDIEGTPLHATINNNRRISGNLADDRRRYEAMAVLLVESGAKLQEFSFGNTELHLAAIRGFADLVPVLVRHGADVNALNDHGHTPLYYAARHGHRRAAEALIAAGADQRAVIETNYGKAPQLTETLAEGEAYLWYLAPTGSPATGYAVKTRNNLLIFDSAWDSDSLDAGLANGCLNPKELAGQKITVLAGQNYGPEILAWAKQMPGVNFVLGFKPSGGNERNDELPPYRLAVAHESFSVGGIQVHTIPTASRIFGKEGLGYLVEADGLKIFHAGSHASGNGNSQLRRYRQEIDFLKRFGPIDLAILPITGRHLTIAYEPYLYLIDQLSPKAIYLIGEELVTEEPRKCLEVLKARNVPVFYPEGGIAIGERFHFRRDQATPLPLPKSDALPLSGDYLGQPPPGATPEVFARGIVSTDHLEHSAPAFSPDGSEVFWSIWRRPEKGEPQVIMTMRRLGGTWSTPTVAPFSGKYVDGGPVFSADGKRLYFASADAAPPLPGGSRVSDIVYVEKTANGWSERKSLGLLSAYPELRSVGGPSFTRAGTLYFRGASGFYRAELVDGKYVKPQLLPPSINQPGVLNWTPFIAPDESYLLFASGRAGSFDRYGDIYISRRLADGSWADPVNLGEPVSTSRQERFQMLSPDGKYLFFTRPTPGHDQDVYWVDAATIPALRPVTSPSQENPK